METTFESRHTSFVSLFPAELKIISNRSHSLGIDTPRITNIKHLFPYFILPSFLPFFLFLFFEFSISKLFHKISTRDTSTKEKYYHENKRYISPRTNWFDFPRRFRFFVEARVTPHARIVHASLSQFGHLGIPPCHLPTPA